MAYRAHKTEHTGAKHGRGAYWGSKYEAKKESNKLRRKNQREEIQQALANEIDRRGENVSPQELLKRPEPKITKAISEE